MSSGIYTKTGYHNRRSIRLPGYDYSRPGAYFVTVCIENRNESLFGNIVNGRMVLNEYGRIVRDEWLITEQMRPTIIIDEYVVMPNHIHGIIFIVDPHHRMEMLRYRRGTLQRAPTMLQRDPLLQYAPTSQRIPAMSQYYFVKPQHEQFGKPTSNSIPTIVRLFRSAATKQINIIRHTPGADVWQRNYYEHIIRDEKSLFRIRQYIKNNPLRWEIDCENARSRIVVSPETEYRNVVEQ